MVQYYCLWILLSPSTMAHRKLGSWISGQRRQELPKIYKSYHNISIFLLWCCLIKFGISSHDLQSLIIWLELISRHFTCLTHLPPYVLILIMFVGYWLLNKASTVCFHDFLSFFPNGTSFFWKNRPPSALTVGGGSIRCSSTWKTTHRRPRISAERGRSGGAVERDVRSTFVMG